MSDYLLPPPEIELSPAQVDAIRHHLRVWGRENYKEFPWRSPAQAWHGLIAEVLLSRTRAPNVVPVYEKFVARFAEAKDLKTATLEEIEALIYSLGLRWRAPLLKQLCDHLAASEGRVPNSLEGLQKLPAVGVYVAAAMLSLHGGGRAVLVDVNVVRFLCRLVERPMDGETRRKRWLLDLADALTPHRKVHEFNYALLDFTMEICKSKPECTRCPVGPKLCLHGRRVLQDQAIEQPPASVAPHNRNKRRNG